MHKSLKIGKWIFGLIIALGFLWLNPVFAESAQVPEEEFQALVALYTATSKGDGWNNADGWNLEQNTVSSEWYGVQVQDGHVIGLYLTFNNLSGSVPEEIGNLSKLHILDLSFNSITAVPGSITDLASLNTVSFRNNKLQAVPNFSQNVSLEYLDVSYNSITFGSLEKNISVPNFEYYGQYIFEDFFEVNKDELYSGQTLSLTANMDGEHNVYEWKKETLNEEEWEFISFSLGITEIPEYVIYNVTTEDTGAYHVEITNELLPDLSFIMEEYVKVLAINPTHLWTFEATDKEQVLDSIGDMHGKKYPDYASGNSPKSTYGIFDTALRFDGVDDYVSFGVSPTSVTDFSLGLWLRSENELFKSSNTSTYQVVASSGLGPVSSWTLATRKISNRSYLYFQINDAGEYHNASSIIYEGSFHHIFVTYNAEKKKLEMLVDMVLKDSKNGKLFESGTGSLTFGLESVANNMDSFVGSIDEFIVTDYVASEEDILEWYKAGADDKPAGYDIDMPIETDGFFETNFGYGHMWGELKPNVSTSNSPMVSNSVNGLVFDGVDDYISFPLSPLYYPLQEYGDYPQNHTFTFSGTVSVDSYEYNPLDEATQYRIITAVGSGIDSGYVLASRRAGDQYYLYFQARAGNTWKLAVRRIKPNEPINFLIANIGSDFNFDFIEETGDWYTSGVWKTYNTRILYLTPPTDNFFSIGGTRGYLTPYYFKGSIKELKVMPFHVGVG